MHSYFGFGWHDFSKQNYCWLIEEIGGFSSGPETDSTASSNHRKGRRGGFVTFLFSFF